MTDHDTSLTSIVIGLISFFGSTLAAFMAADLIDAGEADTLPLAQIAHGAFYLAAFEMICSVVIVALGVRWHLARKARRHE